MGAYALKHRPLAVGRINLLASLEFDLTDGQDMPRALIEQFDDLRVEPVNGLAMFGNAHNTRSMPH